MTRRAMFAALGGLVVPRRTEAAGFHVTGVLGGPDTEGGYFELHTPDGQSGRELIMMTPIRSPLYPHLKALEGKQVQVSVVEP